MGGKRTPAKAQKKGEDREGCIKKALRRRPAVTEAIPATVVYEAETGIANSIGPKQRRQQLAQWLDIVSALPPENTVTVPGMFAGFSWRSSSRSRGSARKRPSGRNPQCPE